MKKNIIFLLGEASSGKDTIGKIFVDSGYTRVSFADAMKQQYADINNIPVEVLHIQGPEKEFHRPKLIEFAESEKKKYPLIWLETALKPYQKDNGEFKDENFNIVITDFRRESEVWWYFNLWKKICEFEEKQGFPNKVSHDINLKMFNITRPGTEDTDVLTHYAIGMVKAINTLFPGFINGTITLPEGKNFTKEQYEKFKEEAKKKVEKLKVLFSL